jgi:hypothetical protein
MVELVQLDNDAVMGGEFSAGRGCRAGASEQRIMHLPVGPLLGQIGQHQRRLRDQLTDDRPIDCISAPLALAE